MKLKGAKQVHYDSGPNMTPLVDVVMVILIFLMLAGSFGSDTAYLVSNLPIRKTGVGKPDIQVGEVEDEQLVVRIDPNSQYGFQVMAGDIRAYGNTENLDQAFLQKKAQYEAAATPVDKIQVILAPSGSVRYDAVARVYEAALRAQFKKVAFQAAQ
jgi:biopolymer transport protein ExbD